MTRAWMTVMTVGASSIAIKAIGPLVFGGRNLPPRLSPLLSHLPPALFAALVVTQVFVHGKAFSLDARAGGLVVALLGALHRAPPVVVLAVAVAATAAIRHFT
jgi:branched-subunit amino acid transport protein